MTTPAGNNGGDVPAVVVVSVAAIILAVIAGVTFLVYNGKDTTSVLTIMGILSPFIIALLSLRNSHRAERKIDGKIDNLLADKTNLEHQVSAAGFTPITATVSFDPESTDPHMQVITDAHTNPHMARVDVNPPDSDPKTNPYGAAAILRRVHDEEGSHNG